MAEPTLVEVFGAGVTQDLATLTISKADLTGLTASATNTAESLLVALLLKSQSHLTQTNFDSNIDQSLVVTEGYASFVSRGTGNVSYRQDQLTVSLAKIDTGATIDPDNY